jgi:hypothetical protein
MDSPYLEKLEALPSQLVFIMGCHRSGTSLLYHLLAYTGQVDYISAYDIIKYDELLHNRISGREAEVKAHLQRLLQREANRGLDELPVGTDVPEEYRPLIHRERGGRTWTIDPLLDQLFFAPSLTKSSVSAILTLLRKKRFLSDADRPLILKNPADYYFNFWTVHEIFPQAKFIFIHRHPLFMFNSYLCSIPPVLNLRSNYASLIFPGYRDLFRRSRLRRKLLVRLFRSNLMSRRLLARLVQSFEYYLSHIERLPPEQYVQVRYEDLCSDPAECISRIGAHLGLNLVPSVPRDFVAPRHLPLLERAKRQYANRVADMLPYLQHCHYAPWEEPESAAAAAGAGPRSPNGSTSERNAKERDVASDP